MDFNLQNKEDIHPSDLLEHFALALRKRLGPGHFDKRILIEKKNNPVGSWNLGKLERKCFHHGSKSLIFVCLSLLGKYQESISNCWDTQLRINTINTGKTKKKKPIKILHLSDLHLDTNLFQIDKWKAIIYELEYDIAVITGDFLNGFQIPGQDEYKALNSFIQSIQTPIFGILGNHDCLMITPYLEEMGVTMLINESTECKINDIKILITGLDDPHYFQGDDINHALKHLQPCSKSYDLNLLLVHAPKSLQSLSRLGYDLFLTGHTHGGQLCTSKGHPLLRNGNYPNYTIAGNWQYGQMQGYTSRGTGTGKLSYRLNCPPEIVLHEIW